MSHRSKSISSHITNETHGDSPVTDEQKHAWCFKRTGFYAVFLSPSMYAALERKGIDMRHYVINKMMPPGTLEAELGSLMTLEQLRDNFGYKP